MCHPWFTTTNLFYRFPISKLPPPPCALVIKKYCALLVIIILIYSISNISIYVIYIIVNLFLYGSRQGKSFISELAGGSHNNKTEYVTILQSVKHDINKSHWENLDCNIYDVSLILGMKWSYIKITHYLTNVLFLVAQYRYPIELTHSPTFWKPPARLPRTS